MTEAEFKERTKQIGRRVIRMVDALPRGRGADVIARQVLRSGTSVGANYRAACRAQSRKHMLSKLRTVEEEADETLYWIETIMDTGMIRRAKVEPLHSEVEAILKMVVASTRTLSRSLAQSKIQNRKPKMTLP